MEFMLETAALARAQGLKNVAVTNGYVNPEPLKDLLPNLDAANVDIKSIEEAFYIKHCRARLKPVLDTCVRMKQAGVHVEVTNLIVTGENDSDENFTKLRDWIHDNLGPGTPVHLSAYHPQYKFSAPATPHETMERALSLVSEKLKHAYLGNVWSKTGSDTKCQGCGNVLVSRSGYHIDTAGLAGSSCTHCGAPAPFVT